MLKDKLYWQVYNQKRKAYLTLKKRESRQRIKAQSTTSFLISDLVSTTTQEKVVDLQAVVNLAGVVDYPVVDQKCLLVVDTNSKQVVDQVVDSSVVDWKFVDHKPKEVVDHPILNQLLQSWKARTNYSCPPTCLYSYCNNCWYFEQDELVDYKEVSM